jgi:hypothetical protein
MGRESRQARRARERREQQRQLQKQRQRHSGGQLSQRALVGGVAVVVAVIAIFSFFALGGGSALTGAAGPTPTPTVPPPGKTIAGIACNNMNTASYHVHAHLDIYVVGKHVAVPAQEGFNYNSSCIYWIHTHDTSGMLHVEAPKAIYPTLATLGQVWSWPISPTRIWNYRVKPGQKMRVWVNQKPYYGDLRNIVLTRHKDITVEIGPPWVTPKPFNYQGF